MTSLSMDSCRVRDANDRAGATVRIMIRLAMAFCLVSGLPVAIGADTETPLNVEAELTSLIGQARENIERLRGVIEVEKTGGGDLPKPLLDEMQLWEELELVVAQRESIREDFVSFGQSNSRSDGSEIVPPRSYLEFDDTRDRLCSSRQKLDLLRLELQAEKNMLAGAKRRYQEAEQKRRRSAEALSESDVRELVRRQHEHSLAVLVSKVLASRLELGREQVALTNLRVSRADDEVVRIEEILKANAGRFVLTREERDQRLSRIDDLESAMWQQLAQVDARMRVLMLRYSIEGQRPDRLPSPAQRAGFKLTA